MPKYPPLASSIRAKSGPLKSHSMLIGERQNAIPYTAETVVVEREISQPHSTISGCELIDKIDALEFTSQDMDEMMRVVQEGRETEYEQRSRNLFD